MEVIGEEYFNHLAARSFFQVFKDYDNIITCKMHNIVHDFAQSLTKIECFSLEVNDNDSKEAICVHSSLYVKAHHSAVRLGNDWSFPRSLHHAKKLRSLFIYWQNMDFNVSWNFLDKLFNVLPSFKSVWPK